MTPLPSPVPDFLKAFRARRHQDLAPFLHEEVVYAVEGFDPLVGRRAVLAYWRRMFETHETVRMSLERHVRDGDLVIAAQRQLYVAGRRQPLLVESMVVYELKDELIRHWSDRPCADDLTGEDAAVWRRLRTARW